MQLTWAWWEAQGGRAGRAGRAGTTDAALSPRPSRRGRQGRRSRQQTQHWLPEICLPSLGTARGPGAAAETRFQLPPRKPGDSGVGSRSRLPAPARSSTPVVPRGPGDTTRTAGTAPPLRGLHAAQVKENENLSVAPSAGKQRPPTHCFTCRETTQQARSTTKGT